MARVVRGRALVAGEAEGEIIASSEPLSFWGGYDANSGEIIDRRHPLTGQFAHGRVLAVPATRGSSTTTAVLLEAIRNGNAPAAILTAGTDTFLSLAAIVAHEMYGQVLPVVALEPADFETLRSGQHAAIDRDGTIRVT